MSHVLPAAANPSAGPHAHATAASPAWVRVADVMSVLTFVIAVAVLVGGGFRFRLGVIRFTATSPVMPWVLLLLLVGARHAVYRRPSLPARMVAGLKALGQSEAWRAVWAPFAMTRVALPVVGLLALATFGYAPGEPKTRLFDDEVMNLPMRWDAGWYYQIARSGYYYDRHKRGQQNIAFFPAFPMATRVVARVFGGSAAAYLVAGVALSHAAFLWALLLLYQLARGLLESDEGARASVVLAACYPFAIFHGAFYTESFFLLGAVGAMLELGRRRPGRAALYGLLAGLTRPNGFLLAAPLLVLAVWRRGVWARAWPSVSQVLAVISPVAGAGLYSAYLTSLTGSPLAWLSQHAAWGRTYTGLTPAVDAARSIVGGGPVAFAMAQPYTAINAVAIAGVLAVVVPVWRRLGPAYAVFLLVNVAPPLVLGGTMSMGRLTATMFPLFVALAAMGPRVAWPLAGAFAAGQGLAAALFYTWRPLY